MKKLLRHILPLSLVVALTACSSDTPDVPDTNDELTLVSFTLSIDNPNGSRSGYGAAGAPEDGAPTPFSAVSGAAVAPEDGAPTPSARALKGTYPATRSETDDDLWWGGEYDKDPGMDFDQRILPTTFHPLLYKVESNGALSFVTEIQPLALLGPTNEANGNLSFAFTGMIVPDETKGTNIESLKAGKYRLMIYTNVYNLTTDDLATPDGDASFSLAGGVKTPGFFAVPMWGVCEFDFSNYQDGRALDLGDLPLLRSMAMIRVNLANELHAPGSNEPQDIDLLSLTINRHNTTGYMAPGYWYTLSNTTASGSTFDKTFRPNSSSLSGALKVSAEDGLPEGKELNKSIAFYIPEIDNDKDNQLTLTVEYRINHGETKGESRTSDLFFCRYGTDGPISPTGVGVPGPNGSTTDMNAWHIVRNHIYEYEISGAQDSKIDVQVRVNNWKYHVSPVQPLD